MFHVETPTLPAPIDHPNHLISKDFSSALEYAKAEKSDNTRKAYQSDFAHFQAWCERVKAVHLPARAEIAAAYLASLADAGLTASTITRRAAAIRYAHRLAGLEPPTHAEPVKAVLRGIRRRIGVAVERKSPATARTLSKLLRQVDTSTLAGKRDRALLLIGFAAALRRSELVDLTVCDLETAPEGVVVHIRSSKTDQEGAGQTVAIPRGSKLRPVEALDEWMDEARIEDGHVFRAIDKGGNVSPDGLSDRSVADIVKKYAGLAKLDASAFSGHSLRAGFVTSALEAGADVLKVMDVTRHTSVQTLKGYDRRARAFKDHAGKKFL